MENDLDDNEDFDLDSDRFRFDETVSVEKKVDLLAQYYLEKLRKKEEKETVKGATAEKEETMVLRSLVERLLKHFVDQGDLIKISYPADLRDNFCRCFYYNEKILNEYLSSKINGTSSPSSKPKDICSVNLSC